MCVVDDTVVQLSTVLERFGVDPRELSPQELNKFVLLLQLLQAEETENTGTNKAERTHIPTQKRCILLSNMSNIKNIHHLFKSFDVYFVIKHCR